MQKQSLSHFGTRLSRIIEKKGFKITGLLFCLVALFAAVGALSSADNGDEPEIGAFTTAAKDWSMKVTPYPKNGEITAGEPVACKVEVFNINPSQKAHLDLGNSSEPTIYVEVRDANDKVLAASPKPVKMADFGSGADLKPGEAYTYNLVISALYVFDKPGEYSIHFQQTNGHNATVIAEGSADIHVLPFNKEVLEARCKQIYNAGFGGIDDKGLDLSQNALLKLLISVRHDAVRPYLERFAKEADSRSFAASIRRIDSPRARAFLQTLAKEKSRQGDISRSVLEKPVAELFKNTMYYMNY